MGIQRTPLSNLGGLEEGRSTPWRDACRFSTYWRLWKKGMPFLRRASSKDMASRRIVWAVVIRSAKQAAYRHSLLHDIFAFTPPQERFQNFRWETDVGVDDRKEGSTKICSAAIPFLQSSRCDRIGISSFIPAKASSALNVGRHIESLVNTTGQLAQVYEGRADDRCPYRHPPSVTEARLEQTWGMSLIRLSIIDIHRYPIGPSHWQQHLGRDVPVAPEKANWVGRLGGLGEAGVELRAAHLGCSAPSPEALKREGAGETEQMKAASGIKLMPESRMSSSGLRPLSSSPPSQLELVVSTAIPFARENQGPRLPTLRNPKIGEWRLCNSHAAQSTAMYMDSKRTPGLASRPLLGGPVSHNADTSTLSADRDVIIRDIAPIAPHLPQAAASTPSSLPGQTITPKLGLPRSSLQRRPIQPSRAITSLLRAAPRIPPTGEPHSSPL
ncbi:hypothetical protein NMY22_g11829 [Coprinellus aureogranulatus]|nr:hypothetical protein NMY22_g11829 [Coprinellus aureogranulatus]